MPDRSISFHSSNEKRLVMVVDDETINREILSNILTGSGQYEVLNAATGTEALALVKEQRELLSLILLDLILPDMHGLDILQRIKTDSELARIPVIVLTADKEAEVESLTMGAIDFIPKPYPLPKVILARVLRTIELSERRDIISHTERDHLTGLLNREYFYRYAEQYDQHHPEQPMDAVVIDVNRFHMINERFGTEYGDEVLRQLGNRIYQLVEVNDALVCRRGADTFLVYMPHREDYKILLEDASAGLKGKDFSQNRVHLRMGVYPNVDKSLAVERRFDRAKQAADTVQGSFMKMIGIYDDALHEKELYAEQLIEDFHRGIEEKQFQVYFQPKYGILEDQPQLAGAEALVRWNHPERGIISPGVFIPLFEDNGLIQELDVYVWEAAAKQLRAWKDRFGTVVPVSVNVSRIDMYDPEIVSTIQSILKKNGLSYEELRLEVTESAYAQDSAQIVRMVANLRKLGFRIEMDDFGTGYSSLNMISRLPVDALKLDMQFLHSAFENSRNTNVLKVIIELAGHLLVPVIAEGVETAEQLSALKNMGCDIAQGYYFSRPVPAEEFEYFMQKADQPQAEKVRGGEAPAEKDLPESLPDASCLEEKRLPAQEEAAREEKQPPLQTVKRHGLQLKTTSYFFVILAFLAAVSLFAADLAVTRGFQRMERASEQNLVAQMAAANMETVSDYLTDRVRCFVITGDLDYLKDFFEEVETTRRRDQALADLERLLEDSNSSAYSSLASALELSNELVEREYLAMRLMLETGDYDMTRVPGQIADIVLSREDKALSEAELRQKAQDLVFDSSYMHAKERIRENVSSCTRELIHISSQELEQASARMAVLVHIQTAITVVFLLIVLLMVVFIYTQVRRPLTRMVERMQQQRTIPPTGAEELQFVTRTYNSILRENQTARERLRHEASHDALTGLLNRGAYEMMLTTVDMDHLALILVDVDYFKMVNDTYGHDVGDRVLKRVAKVLKSSFRSVDIICRIGGDEFVVLMTRVNSSMRDLVINKIRNANEQLLHPKDDLPPVSLSVGVAFSDRKNPQGDIFKDADIALYRIKVAGKCGCEVY